VTIDVPPPLSEDLAPDRLLAALSTSRFGRHYEPHARAGSTNDLIAARAREGAEEGLVVLADEQIGGRGQKGRAWLTTAGMNLTFSLLLRPDRPAASLPPLTLLAGVAVAEALTELGLRPRLKWPNDVLCDTPAGPRKLVGVLTDMATQRDRVKHVIVGVGINVNQTAFAPEIAGLATSIRAQLDRFIDRTLLLARVLGAFERRYDDALAYGPASFLDTWRMLADLPRPCAVARPHADNRPRGLLTGTAVDVDHDGALIVVDDEGLRHRVLSGELTSL
jgi:BirA family biotin operon repressor/biotin-[acetyl-CoA-carboxylase] ligase